MNNKPKLADKEKCDHTKAKPYAATKGFEGEVEITTQHFQCPRCGLLFGRALPPNRFERQDAEKEIPF